jgi:hypothetical protein
LEWQDDYLGADTNLPQDGSSVGGTLDDIVRNIKSVQRAESENKEWVRSGLTPTYVSATSFTVAGDHRVDLPAGRRLKATISGATKYGTVLSSSYGASVTTVTVQWDLEEEIHAFSRVDANTVKFLWQDLRSTFAVNTRVQFWNDSKLSTQRKTRVVSSVSFSTNTTVVFTGGDPYETIDSSDDRVLVPSTGIDNTVSEVQFGTLTPDMYESGWAEAGEGLIAKPIFHFLTLIRRGLLPVRRWCSMKFFQIRVVATRGVNLLSLKTLRILRCLFRVGRLEYETAYLL